MNKKVTNTSREASEEPLANLAKIGLMGSRGIERQEAEGQRELVASGTQIPRDLLNCTREDLESLGFVFVEDPGDDELFQNVTLPGGWSLRPTEHSMWTELIDSRGEVRGSLFYKAAFYDRKAHLVLRQRFAVTMDHESPDGEVVYYVKDRDKVVHTERRGYQGEKYAEGWLAADRGAHESAKAWLHKGYPKADELLAYWDE